jgi:hypothetical protein
MSPTLSRVAFVAAGQIGQPSDYLYQAELFKMQLDRANAAGSAVVFEAEIFTEVGPAIEYLNKAGSGLRSLALLSNMFQAQSESLAKANPHIRVFVITGAYQAAGEVQVIRKGWIDGRHGRSIAVVLE